MLQINYLNMYLIINNLQIFVVLISMFKICEKIIKLFAEKNLKTYAIKFF